MSHWKEKSAPTHEYKIFIAGNYDGIEQACRSYCEKGLCVSVKKADYVFKFGMESGAEITLINYPRFPASEKDTQAEAFALARFIAEENYQGSYTVQGPSETFFFSRRDFD